MRPIDFQTSLSQMGEVAKTEDLKRKQREDDKKKAEAKTKVRLTEEVKSEASEMPADLVKPNEPVQPDPKGRRHQPHPKSEKPGGLPEKFKGNFLDISE